MSAPTLRNTVPGLTADQLLAAPGTVVVDLRSPGEFAADHVPGAINAPLFGDVERALIGTLYKRVSPEAAFAEARVRVERRIDELVGLPKRAPGTLPMRR